MIKKPRTAWILLTASLALSACARPAPPADGGKLQVVVTIDALYEFAAAVGGELAEVYALVPPGAEAHDFEPKPRDLERLSAADVFIYNGLGLEPWARDALAAAKNGRLVTAEASEGASLISVSENEYDPHVWLSLTEAAREAENIRDALSLAAPESADAFARNCAAFTDALSALYDEYSVKLADAAGREFVTGHAAFAYLCRDFGLSQRSVENLYAEGEPTPKRLAELIEFCVENNIKTVFTERAASPAVSETLARACGATLKPIYTIEAPEDGLTYLERMTYNLEQLAENGN
jgi:zinc transport system substrate-binding protein